MDPRSLPDQPAAAVNDHTPAAFYEVARTQGGWELHCGRCGTGIATSANTPAETDQLATAHHYPSSPPAEPTSTPAGRYGPYEQPPQGLFIAFTQRAAMAHAALAGVELGAFDRRILGWLAHFCDTPTFLSLLGILQRARIAAGQRPADRAGEYELTKGHFSDDVAEAIVAERRLEQERDQARDVARLLLDHLGLHLDEPPAGLPAWVYTRAGYDRDVHQATQEGTAR